MFQRLYELGCSLPERETWERLNEGMPPKYDRGLAICFDKEGCYIGIETINGNEKVIYRAGPSKNGPDFTPCRKLSPQTAKLLLRGVKELAKYGDLDADKNAWLEATINCFEKNKDNIWEELELKKHQAGIDDKNHYGYVYWARENVSDPVFSWSEVKNFMVKKFFEVLSVGGTRKGNCLTCGKGKRIIYGNFSVLPCYNLDKPGSIAGGFNSTYAHRNLPICYDCVLLTAEAFSFVRSHLNGSMAGQKYIILPYANSEDMIEELKLTLNKNPDKFNLHEAQDLVADEISLIREYENRGDQLAFYLVFFKSEKAEWRIQAEVQQLLPSRMKTLYEAKKQIENSLDLASAQKDADKPLQITAMTFRNFSGTAKSASSDTLRAWLVALFEHRSINYKHFLHHLVSGIISSGKTEPDKLLWIARQAWGLYRYCLLTDLISPSYGMENEAMQEAIPNSAYGRYIQAHPDFFRKPEIVTAFLTGCYASQVARAQYERNKATPFVKKFIGRLLSRQHLQRLYREGHAKLTQYDKLGYVITSLDPDLAAAWVACGECWIISEEEATFAFTIGYSLAYRIAKLDPQHDNQESQE